MKSNKKINRKNKPKNNAMIVKLSRQMNLFNKKDNVTVVINNQANIYWYTVTNLYSFANGSDVRNYNVGTALTSNTFTKMASVYADYRVKSIAVTLNPTISYTLSNEAIPMLYLGCDPQIVSNPTNSNFIESELVRLFSPYSVAPQFVKFLFPGVGVNTNLWIPVTQTTGGSILIGNNPTGYALGSDEIVFDVCIGVVVEFSNLIGS